MKLEEKEQIEIEWWKDSKFEGPSKFTKENFLNKMRSVNHFHYKLRKYRKHIQNKSNVLELGAGQGWASCFLKRYFLPDAHFTTTDISPYAVASIKHWERIFETKIDQTKACKSYDTSLESNQFDLIFCYSAAHHFVKQEETIKELSRILKPGGKILYLFEPSASRLFYPLYYKYVNWAPHSTPEDVLIPSTLKNMAQKYKLQFEHYSDPHQSQYLSLFVMFYFKTLSRFPFLQKILPTSSDFILIKH